MTELAVLRARLAAILGNLAARYDEQSAYLSTIGVGDSADELALEFDDIYRPVLDDRALLNLSESVVQKLAQLDSMLAEMSGPLRTDLWTLAGLQASGEWSKVRKLAGEIRLELMRQAGDP